MTLNTSTESPEAKLAQLLEKSSKRTNIPVRKAFVRRLEQEENEPPLHKIYVGGQNGSVAVKLYLAILWKAVAEPYDVSDVPASTWAALLGLDDPMGKGRKKIYTALEKLSAAHLIRKEQRAGYPPKIFLLSDSGNEQGYIPPTSAAFTDTRGGGRAQDSNLYFKVPSALWTTGKIQSMSGPALVMYLILAAEEAYKREVWFSSNSFPQRYSFGAKLRAQGTKELREPHRDLLQTRRVPLSDFGAEDFSFEIRRSRKLYKLVNETIPEQ